MTKGQSFEQYLNVGNRVILYPDPRMKGSQRYQAVIDGWHTGQSIRLRLLLEKDRTLIFRPHAECSFRFLHDGVACSADALLIDWQASKRSPEIRITWPTSVRAAMVRRDERIRCSMPGMLSCDGEETACEVLDLSKGGLGLQATLGAIAISRAAITFTLPDGVVAEGVTMIVRNTQVREDGATYMGCAFEPLEQDSLYGVNFYISSTLMRRRGANPSSPRVLVIHEEPHLIKHVVSGLVAHGYDVAVMDNLLDGLFQARLTVPTVTLVHLPAAHEETLYACRLMRGSRALAGTPVYLFGGAHGAGPDGFGDYGIDGCLPELDSAAHLIETLVDMVSLIETYELERKKLEA